MSQPNDMLRVLRQLTATEMRQVTTACGARPGAAPEEVVRALGKATGTYLWGIFPITTHDALLDQLGRKLGMAPLVPGGGALAQRERAILACYLRQAWDAAGRETRERLLKAALEAWDCPGVPAPELAPVSDQSRLHPTLEALLQQTAGCRALAVATESVPLPLPSQGESVPLYVTLGTFGTLAVRPGAEHQPFYAVLLVLWRARARLLRDRRMQRAALERQTRQLEGLLQVRRQNLDSAPVSWVRSPQSGAALVLAAGTSSAIHLALGAVAPVTLLPTLAVGAAGVIWSMTAASAASRAPADERLTRMSSQMHGFRSQLSEVEKEIRALETE
ncbi:MAG: hypothetical protein ACK47B_16165 [Armatimonadota bacterium]